MTCNLGVVGSNPSGSLQRVNMHSSKKAAVTPYRNMVGASQSALCVIKRAVSEAETV